MNFDHRSGVGHSMSERPIPRATYRLQLTKDFPFLEAAKLAPRQHHELAQVYEKEKQKGNANRATLAVARKMVAYLLAVDRREQAFVVTEDHKSTAA
jgi:hypothetical protein